MASLSIGSSTSSGIDVDATVSQILYAERAPERLMEAQRTRLQMQASALGQVQTELSALKSKVNALKDISGVLNTKLATSSNSSVASASASTTAVTGKHTLLVNRLATTSTYYSDVISGTKLTHGSFTLSVGGQSKTLTISDSNDTLSGFVNYVNGLNAGVTASTLTDASGTRLVLVSDQSGSPGQISISGSAMPFPWNKGADGLNAQFALDGIPLESSTNTPSDVIPGVALTLAGTSASEVQLTVAPDTTRARQAISDFVAAYNALVKDINGQFSYDAATKTAGVLSGDPAIRGLQAALLSNAAYAKDEEHNAIVSLSSLGVKMENDGTLTIDSSKLDEMLKTCFADVQDFFQSTEVEGFARHFGASLDDLTDSMEGPIQVDLNGIKAEQDSLSDQIEAYEVRMEMRQQLLLEQFSKIDAMLRQLPLLQAQLTAQLGSLE